MSDESRAIATFTLRGLGGRAPSLELRETYALDVGRREKPEGLCIDGDTIWVATDGEPYLYELRRPRRPRVAGAG
ncbi:MAG: hypothetical protein HY908_13245 [Myxococcales bacterium]|nr:hypothetical protein [Myxococcales bacterium]